MLPEKASIGISVPIWLRRSKSLFQAFKDLESTTAYLSSNGHLCLPGVDYLKSIPVIRYLSSDLNTLVKNKPSYIIRFFALLLLTGLWSCAAEEHPAMAYEIKGIDVSRYQSIIDWTAVKADGIAFVFAKATEGGDYRDPLFAENWSALRQQRIRRGAYHFFRPEVSAEIQAANFIAQVDELLPGDLPPVLDVETRGGLPQEIFDARLAIWLQLVEARFGMPPIIYSGQVFYNRHLAGRYADYPVWIARYKDELPVLADGRPYQFWQYGETGMVRGISGPVDLNIFTGSHEDLALLSQPVSALVAQPNSPMATTTK